MSKRIIILSILFSLGISSYSQVERFNKTFVLSYQNKPQTIFETDSGYILGCWYNNAISMVDLQGNFKWEKNYYPQGQWASFIGSNSPNALNNTGNSTFISGGIMQNSGPTANKVYSIKYSDTFDTMYMKLLLEDTVTLNNYVYNCLKSSDEKYVFVGHSGYSGMLIRTDTNSNFIDSTLILKGTNDYNWFNSGLQMGNYFYLIGATRAYAPIQVTGFDRTDGWVVKTDLQGNEINSISYGNQNYYDGVFTTGCKYENKIMTITSIATNNNIQGFTLAKPLILILNDDLSVYKEVFFNEGYSIGDTLFGMGLVHFTSHDSSSYSYLGLKTKYDMTSFQMIQRIAIIISLDNNFKVKYHRNYVHQGSNFNNINPQLITTTSDSGYIFGGYVQDSNLSPPAQAWLVKTDSLGCDGYTSCNDTAMVVEILNYSDTLCQNDTNFIEVRLKGRSAPYSLYANSTLALDSIYYPYSLPLWIDTIMPFYPTDTGWQTLIITVHEPWERIASDTIQVYVKNCINTSANLDYYKHNIEIYPNPTESDIIIKCTLPLNKTGKVIVYKTTGSKLGEYTIDSGYNKFIIPTRNWKENVILVGVYVEGRQVIVEKIIKD